MMSKILGRVEVVELINELVEASEKYYVEKTESFLTDEEFDEKRSFVEKCSVDYPELFTVGSKGYDLLENSVALGAEFDTSVKTIVEYKKPMLSLRKANNENDLKKFAQKMVDKGAVGFNLQCKLDGFALSAVYVGGILDQISVRGDGFSGEKVNYLVEDPNSFIVGLPDKINNCNDVVEVRGEIFFTDEQFKKADDERFKIFGRRFMNSRNACVGLMSKSEKGLEYPVEFTFCVYNLIVNDKLFDADNDNFRKFSENFYTIDDLTSEQVNDFRVKNIVSVNELFVQIEGFGKLRDNFNVPTDGVVVKPVNESFMNNLMGSTAHHPSSQIAFKYPSPVADSKILSINLTVGRTGRITPVAVVEPVVLLGSVIRECTLHNFSKMRELDVRVGSVVAITKANDVIPQVKTVVYNDVSNKIFDVPENCPSCGKKLVNENVNDVIPKTLKCVNIDCPERVFNNLLYAFNKNALDIDGLSEAILKSLHDNGLVKVLSDVYKLEVDDFKDLTMGVNKRTGTAIRIGEKRARHIVEQVEKSKNVSPDRILVSLGIDSLGRSVSKQLLKIYDTVNNLLNVSQEELSNINGIGSVMAKNIFVGLSLRKNLLVDLVDCGVRVNDSYNGNNIVVSNEVNSKIFGKSFSISGSVPNVFDNRAGFVAFVEDNGGFFHSSPKKTTDFMIGDVNDSSVKIVKAQKNGVSIISPDVFVRDFM